YDTGMFYGVKFFNDILMEAGKSGYVQSEVLLLKNKETFTFSQGWAFPRRVYFNDDECIMPSPDSYPFLLPMSSTSKHYSLSPSFSSQVVGEIVGLCDWRQA
ncbi:COBRA-like protein 4-like, partial [Trifolium medium]|nr:COBRA-like protein 4-like [Trifolium medium]